MAPQPHERRAGEAGDRAARPGAEAHGVGDRDARGQRHEDPPPVGGVEPGRDRHRRDHPGVHGEEPQGHEDDQPPVEHRAPAPGPHREVDGQPAPQPRHQRRREPAQAGPQEAGGAATVPGGRLPPREVGVAADEEEHGHDLEHPGRRPQAGHVRDRVRHGEAAVVPVGHGQRPVPQDDDADARGPQQVDDPVAGRRRGVHEGVEAGAGRGGRGGGGGHGATIGPAGPRDDPGDPPGPPRGPPR